jgi:DNA-binding LacI/PurR family transcriptional regulator
MERKSPQTIDDIARLAGVSKSTVSRALNDSSLISRETKDRIREIAKAHNFHINAPARRLSLRQSRTVAFASCPFQDDFTVADQFGLEIMSGVGRGLSELGYDMLVVQINRMNQNWASPYLDSGRVDGIILMSSSGKRELIQRLIEIEAPFIAWGLPNPGHSHCTVSGDNVAGTRMATEHLIATGRRRIAFLGGPSDEMEVKARLAGYETALRRAGRPVDPALIEYSDYCDMTTAVEAMKRLLGRCPDLDGVVANADLIAIGVIDYLRSVGRSVPGDVGVTGYDDLSLAAVTSPALTTVRQCISTGGKLLAHNLIQYLRTGIVTNVTMPSQLIVRQST